MFVIEETDQIGPAGDHKRVIDHERDAWIQRVGGPGMSGHMPFKLVWQRKVIPFDVLEYEVKSFAPSVEIDPQPAPLDHIHWRFRGVGIASSTSRKYGIEDYNFQNDDEKAVAVQLIAEALIVFGRFYGGKEGYPCLISYLIYDREKRDFFIEKRWHEEI